MIPADADALLAPLRTVLLNCTVGIPPAPIPPGSIPPGSNPIPPGSLPRLTAANLSVTRTWRLPRGGADGFSHAFGGLPLALDEEHDSLFVGNNAGRLAEVSIPPPGQEFGTWLQDFVEPSDGAIAALSQAVGPAALAGALVIDGELCLDALVYYDALSAQRVSHPRLKTIAMASCDTVAETHDAWSWGWRTFRVRLAGDKLLQPVRRVHIGAPKALAGEFVCPASDEAGHRTTCEQCQLCRGTGSPARSVAIVAHGKASNLKAFGIDVRGKFGRPTTRLQPIPLLRSKDYRRGEVPA